ncbi:MAG: ABC transporter substrate-binding protein [Promethearchaeota archaeon]
MKKIVIVPAVVLILIMMLPAQIDTFAFQAPARDEILWSSGYWAPPLTNNPTHWGPSWESKFMYEVLFDWNSLKTGDDRLVGFIGESMTWGDAGKTLTIKLRPEAKWSDGNQIVADDVVYTFWDLYAGEGGPLNSTFTKRLEGIEKVDDTTVKVTLKDAFKYSRSVYFQFVGRWQVLPSHIWPQIAADPDTNEGGLYLMTVNWLDPDFPEEYKVCSGMYIPHSVAVDNSWSLYERRDDWWGVGVLSPTLPVPKYIGMKAFPNNFAQSTEFISDGIDWFGGYVQSIDRVIEDNPSISTYYGQEAPYFASLSGMVEIVPNHLIYPLNQLWLRKAMAYAINRQDMIDIGASGYMEPARVTIMDDRSPVLADYYDESIQDEYAFDYNLTKAEDYMLQGCLDPATHSDPGDSNSPAVGKWYTKDTPAAQQTGLTDAWPLVPGFNVQVGPYGIESVLGWSDFTLHTTTFSLQMQQLGITINPSYPDYGGFVADSQNMDFDILLYGIGPGLMDRPLTIFNYYTGPAGQGVNTSGWYDPTYVTKVEQFEVAEPGSTQELSLASDLQEELAKNLPSIPLFANGYWYSYNTMYWINWPTEASGVMPPMAMWQFGNAGLMNQLVWSLQKGTGQKPTATTPWPLIIPLACALFVVLYLKKKKRKE